MSMATSTNTDDRYPGRIAYVGESRGRSAYVIDCGQVEKAPDLRWIKERPNEYP